MSGLVGLELDGTCKLAQRKSLAARAGGALFFYQGDFAEAMEDASEPIVYDWLFCQVDMRL